MPPQPGEELLLTLFADIHYYYAPPGSKPPHHRFDKGCYLYLYHNSTSGTSKIEVANNPGTADQDAFSGYLDGTHLEYSYKHDTLFTLSVEGRPLSFDRGHSPGPPRDHAQWHLPGPDQHNQGRYMLKLHTLDIYFWTKEDALQFLEALKKILGESQLRILNAPKPLSSGRNSDSISSVVQHLENAAISNPTYGRSPSGSTSATSPHSPNLSKVKEAKEANPTPPPAFAPMAYNPAAPPAPEPIKHREKTPPPLDAEEGLGLQAAKYEGEHGRGFAPPPGQQHGSFPPAHTHGPPMGGIHRQQTFGAPPTQHQQVFTGPPLPQSLPHSEASDPRIGPGHMQRAHTTAFGGHPPTSISPHSQGYEPSYRPPPSDPNAHLYGHASPPPPQQPYTGQYGSPPQQQHYLQHRDSHHSSHSGYTSTPPPNAPGYGAPPSQPAGVPSGTSYSNFQYEQQSKASAPSSEYSMHQQVYRPTEEEAVKYRPAKPPSIDSQGNEKKPAGFDKLDKGVGKFFKKIEKRIG